MVPLAGHIEARSSFKCLFPNRRSDFLKQLRGNFEKDAGGDNVVGIDIVPALDDFLMALSSITRCFLKLSSLFSCQVSY